MTCPYLKEVVMLTCEACAVRKLLPLDRVVTGGPCTGNFHDCSLFNEVMTRLAVSESDAAACTAPAATARRDGRQ
jgi:hypothetical protein